MLSAILPAVLGIFLVLLILTIVFGIYAAIRELRINIISAVEPSMSNERGREVIVKDRLSTEVDGQVIVFETGYDPTADAINADLAEILVTEASSIAFEKELIAVVTKARTITRRLAS